MSTTHRLILASTSRYRAELLGRLRFPFVAASPEVDESVVPGEKPANLAQRLARAKALAVAAAYPSCWVIGSDQVASLGDLALGKPGTVTAAITQLRAQSAQAVRFFTAVAIYSPDGSCHSALDETIVRFRQLSDREIERYVAAEPALDCAGAFKCEGLGITLFEAIETRDPTALIGLPLIATARLLAEAGFVPP